MNFDTAKYLTKATSRAKSDVANKLVGMFLHELSRKISPQLEMRVSDPSYTKCVAETFGSYCAYCNRKLENDRVAVEHLDGMNRFRIGLHIVGNVVISCKRCNNEKRRDDSKEVLSLANSGWESFLAHNGDNCNESCKTCHYWNTLFPIKMERNQSMFLARERISNFRLKFPKSILCGKKALNEHKVIVEKLYRDGQEFATRSIQISVSNAIKQISL